MTVFPRKYSSDNCGNINGIGARIAGVGVDAGAIREKPAVIYYDASLVEHNHYRHAAAGQ